MRNILIHIMNQILYYILLIYSENSFCNIYIIVFNRLDHRNILETRYTKDTISQSHLMLS